MSANTFCVQLASGEVVSLERARWVGASSLLTNVLEDTAADADAIIPLPLETLTRDILLKLQTILQAAYRPDDPITQSSLMSAAIKSFVVDHSKINQNTRDKTCDKFVDTFNAYILCTSYLGLDVVVNALLAEQCCLADGYSMQDIYACLKSAHDEPVSRKRSRHV
jgi:hypothetical protein